VGSVGGTFFLAEFGGKSYHRYEEACYETKP
jgi:hypothetical protein